MTPQSRGVRLIILINVIVFFLWQYFGASERNVMTENFLVSWNAVVEGRVWTLLTSVFSHNMMFHILLNMFVLFSFGLPVETTLGTKRFVTFYLVAGIVASICHCVVSMALLGQPDMLALGASGAISGVVVVFAMLFPQAKILLFGIVPMPAIWGVVLAVALDAWGLIAQTRGGGFPIGFGAHIGGALSGLIYYLVSLRRTPRRLNFVA